MAIELNHTIVPAHDKEKSARFYERIFGFVYKVRIRSAPPASPQAFDFENTPEANLDRRAPERLALRGSFVRSPSSAEISYEHNSDEALASKRDFSARRRYGDP
jgi:catechol 2,3-dioxygenase-like lactoylglutathione lyase family enzyme